MCPRKSNHIYEAGHDLLCEQACRVMAVAFRTLGNAMVEEGAGEVEGNSRHRYCYLEIDERKVP